MTKKIFSLVLVLAMLCAFVPCVATAAESGSCGDNVTWVLDDNGTLYISGTGTMNDYYPSNGYHDGRYPAWFDNSSAVTSIVIGDGVANIGNYAFLGCSSATSVTFGNRADTIGEYAFSGCSGLKSITIPSNITTINDGAFYRCTGLRELTLLDSITTVGESAFNGCTALRSVTIGNGVSSIGACAFQDCTNLSELTIGNKVTVIGNEAFKGCTKLTSVVIPNKVTTIGMYAFQNCNELASVTLPYSLTKINGGAFSGNFLSAVYYEGSSEDWQYITIGGGNDSLDGATIYCDYVYPVITTAPTTSTNNNTVIVILNGVTLVFDYPPTIIDGRTLVPLRKIFESIGATVTWDDATKTVISTYNGVTITLTIGSNILYKNGYPVELDVPAQLLSDYTMVPVRAVAESFGADVAWDGNTNTVTITTN